MKITPRTYAIGLISALEKAEDQKEVVKSFLSVLWRKKHFKHLPKILKNMEEELDKKFGIMKLDIWYPKKFVESLKDLQEVMEKFYDKKILITPFEDNSLIGGYRIRKGELLIDASISGQIKKLKTQMEESSIK